MSEKKKARTRLMKRFTLPDGLDCKTVVMRELDGNDDITVSVWTERMLAMNKVAATSGVGVMNVQSREELRCSIVAVDNVRVNVDDVPFGDMTWYSAMTMDYLTRFFREMNRVDGDAVKKAVEEAQILTEEDLLALLGQAAP